MKKLLFILLLCPLFCLAQDRTAETIRIVYGGQDRVLNSPVDLIYSPLDTFDHSICVHAVNIPHHCCAHPKDEYGNTQGQSVQEALDELWDQVDSASTDTLIWGGLDWGTIEVPAEQGQSWGLPVRPIEYRDTINTGTGLIDGSISFDSLVWNGADHGTLENDISNITIACTVNHGDQGQCTWIDGRWVPASEMVVRDTISPAIKTHDNGTKYQLHLGLQGSFLFYDSSGPSSAGGGGGIVATYSNEKHFWSQAQVGYAYLFSDLGDRRVIQFSGAMGYADGPFAVGLDIGSLQFIKGQESSAMSIGLIGQFAAPVGDNLCVLSNMRAGILAKEQTTYFQSVSLGVQMRL